jgi:aryl-alcohol dehydrogenase-like predicted oxidoreductase
METLDTLRKVGKIRYSGVSNFASWQIMKSQGTARLRGYSRHVAHQVYYSLIGRDYEWDLMPMAQDQGIGAIVWSPLGWGRLTGKIRRSSPIPAGSRLHETAQYGPPVDNNMLYDIIDVLDEIAEETSKSVPQIALNWLLQRPTVSSVIIGARNEQQLRDNLGAAGWALSADHIRRLDTVSKRQPPYPHYPYYIQEGFARLNPPLIPAT